MPTLLLFFFFVNDQRFLVWSPPMKKFWLRCRWTFFIKTPKFYSKHEKLTCNSSSLWSWAEATALSVSSSSYNIDTGIAGLGLLFKLELSSNRVYWSGAVSTSTPCDCQNEIFLLSTEQEVIIILLKSARFHSPEKLFPHRKSNFLGVVSFYGVPYFSSGSAR